MTNLESIRASTLIIAVISSLGSIASVLILPWLYLWLKREFVSRQEWSVMNTAITDINTRIDEHKSDFREIYNNATEARNITSEVKHDLYYFTNEIKSIPRLDERINHMTESLERVEDMLNVIIKTHVQEGIKSTK
ncbi:MAG: hypothetical protein QM537_03780 [Candidatus Symbiobacter sp.]|nr:hypothetical protein [Candidatus Symbiobacter sp.]